MFHKPNTKNTNAKHKPIEKFINTCSNTLKAYSIILSSRPMDLIPMNMAGFKDKEIQRCMEQEKIEEM